jgi:hypothetical protein
VKSGILLAVVVSLVVPAVAQGQARSRDDQRRRNQIRLMEGVLVQAVRLGAEEVSTVMERFEPAGVTVLSGVPRARGFVLDGYGVFFDVEVPSLQGTLAWSFRTLDQNALGLDSALRTLRAFVQRSSSNDVNLEQALRRIELQVGPVAALNSDVAPPAETRIATGTATAVPEAPDPGPREAILADPNEAWRAQVREALLDTMLEHSRGLSIGSNEMLTVAARGITEGPRLAPPDTEARTVVITVHGADLTSFLAGQISRDEARKRVEVRVF